jgi:energy-converting hydrogenase B subunit D
VLNRNPIGQALALAVFGLCFTVLALVLQAPDVALSMLVVGSAIVPMLVLLAIASGRKPSPEDTS